MTTTRRPEILAHLKAQNGIARETMAWLRNRFDPSWDKLSKPRSADISAWLQAQKILHQPAELPSRETEKVTLYSLDSVVGMVVAAARVEGPFSGNASFAHLFLQGHADGLAKREADDESAFGGE
ncbi:hypothetical protein [Streptomyces natalensis]|uniref:Uncharacterized protein n=1 Tax=Streptomyces natalensis ATCC 27448 TaxID=1240678 RepID=A0A0D7CN17_9ACTN|nr:hypothetical protein [Streptomyces natalensis]KIZ16812.1 hypothetical protein SNA_17570 [Streptomyces natalensis ATCC 27448]